MRFSRFSTYFGLRATIGILTFLLGPFVISAAVTQELTAATLSHNYLLDSDSADGDPRTNRHTAETQFSATIRISAGTLSHLGNYRIAYQLENSKNQPVELVNGGPINQALAYTTAQSVSLNSLLGQSVTQLRFQAMPDPVATLSPQISYRVRGVLQEESSPGNWQNVNNKNGETATELTQFLHFTNTSSSDAAYNVRAGISDLSWLTLSALSTDPDNQSFNASADIFYSRWDGYERPTTTDQISFTIDFDLIEQTSGESIPLENDGIIVINRDVNSHRLLSPIDRISESITANIKPLRQLKSASERYQLNCQVSHLEDIQGSVFANATSRETSRQLLHFSGELSFGSFPTTFQKISNNPTVGAGTTQSFVQTMIAIPTNQGLIDNRSEYRFGDGAPLSVQLRDDGTCKVIGGSQEVYLPDSENDIECNHGGIQLKYGSVNLSSSGASATNMTVLFPQGLNLIVDQSQNAFLGETQITKNGPITLQSDLCPESEQAIPLGADARLSDEAHPLSFEVNNLTVMEGKLLFSAVLANYVHDAAYAQIESLRDRGRIDHSLSQRRSNDRYLKNVSLSGNSITITSGSDGTARLSASLTTAGGDFEPHFPTHTQVNQNLGSELILANGHPAPEQALEHTEKVRLQYYQTCEGDDCTSDIPPETISQAPEGNLLHPLPNGGLHSQGNLTLDTNLIWGRRSPDQYAHRTSEFQSATFYMPGYQLYAEDNRLLKEELLIAGDADQTPALLLLSGFNGNINNPVLNYSTDPAYNNGIGDLPGLNFIVTSAQFPGASRLGGNLSDYEYKLLPDASKYYIRLAGVSGRQVATDGTFDPELLLHGFPCQLSQFQLTFLDSDNSVPGTSSWVDGTVQTVGPYSRWSQSFTGLRFDCLGEPGEMDVDLSATDDKALTYWNSSFNLKSLKFIKEEKNPGSCPKQFRALLLAGAQTKVAHIEQTLYGAFAFSPDGNLSNESTKIEGYNSQLGIPATVLLSGPNQDYHLVTSSKLRFNNPLSIGAPDVGFVTFAATIDIPYFVDLQIQAITSATPGNTASFYLTPGWSDSGANFFNKIDFDPTHQGFPSAGITFSEFRQPNSNTPETYLITAEQKLFNVIDLRYPLKWDTLTRRFSSMKSQKQELFVTQVEHQIEWMDAKFANISFGAKYDGLPQLKLSNYLNEEIDDAASIISSQIDQLAKRAVDQAIEGMDEMLEDSLETLVTPIITASAGTEELEGPIRNLHAHLLEIADEANGDYLDFRQKVETTLTETAALEYQSRVLNPIKAILNSAGEANGEAQSFINQLDHTLQNAIKGIDAICQGVEISGGEVQFNIDLPTNVEINSGNHAPGLLFKESDQRNLIRNVIRALLSEYLEPDLIQIVVPLLEVPTSDLNNEINRLLEELDPTLEQIRTVLLEIRSVLVEVQLQVAESNGVAEKINEIISNAGTNGLLDNLIEPLGIKAWNHFLQLEAALGVNLDETVPSDIDHLIDGLNINEFIILLQDELRSQILGSEIVEEMQFILRQTLYDIHDRVTSSLQSVLDQLSGVIKEVVAQAIGDLEEQINPLIGTVDQYMGSGEITGYAEVNGDSLRKLRLDAQMQLKLPEEMSLHVYLEILSYSSEDNFVESGCIQPGEKAVEVRMGAKDVAIDWISDIRVNLEVKMSLKDHLADPFDFPVPNGVGGSFEMTDGVLNFQSFQVLEFGATIAVGGDEAYIGAKARAVFSDYEVAAAIFFGRTCTLEPLLFVDPDIGEVVNAGTTFTGAYVYGEVWLPISELVLGVPASCMFRIDAGVGAGAFYFVEGATYGGKMLLGVSGEALCMVNIRGEVKMIVASQAGNMRGSGTGKFSAKVGSCPFCIKFRKSVKIKYDNGNWSLN